MDLFEELEYLGKYLGSRIDLVQAGGGNISIKEGGILYIKSSGCVLSEMEKDFGFTKVNLANFREKAASLNDLAEDKFGEFLEEVSEQGNLRPSIETPLHAFLNKRIVIHIHPIACMAFTSQTNSTDLVKKYYPEAVWIPYATPGKSLALAFNSNTINKEKSLYFLENHGAVFAGDKVEDLLQEIEKSQEMIGSLVGLKFEKDRISSEIMKVLYREHHSVKSVLKVEDSLGLKLFKSLNEQYEIICPDDVVYLGASICHIKSLDGKCFTPYFLKYKCLPKVIYFDKCFYIVGRNIVKCRQIYDQLLGNLFARKACSSVQTLSENEIIFLSNWEAEKYRQDIKVN